MAPSRRRGARKGAAAAARRQYKVGDLVLAKVKGYPAWPAMVSEPEKWGYSSDRKKVLVYFFGTQQIAFCNPGDVEAFTEEKKQSLAKRQGRGSDFVRAVREIIESYEKLKRQTQVDETCSSDEVANVDVSKSVDQSAILELKGQTAKDGSAVALRDESCNTEASWEEPADNAAANATVNSPLPVTYSSPTRYKDLHQEAHLIRKNAPVRRSRSSSRVQSFVVPCSVGGNNAGNTHAAAVLRRNKRIRKSPDLFVSDEADSSPFASKGSMEENGSEIIATDSDFFSLNEGSAIDFKLGHSETIECAEGEVDLNKGLDLEFKAVFNKKKRKPNRQRPSNDSAKPTISPEEASAQKANHSVQSMRGNAIEQCFEQRGDEHLPLSKRARVRMGQSSTEAKLNNAVQAQEKSCKEDIINSPQQIITSSKGENDNLADGDSSALTGALVHVSSSKLLAQCSESGSQICKNEKEQIFGSSMDDEAALPPTKRLHRALEAMSANAAEEGKSCLKSPLSIMTSSGRCCISSIKRSPYVTTDNSKGGNDLELQGLDSCSIDCSHVSVCSFSTSSNPMVSTENKLSTEVDKQLTKYKWGETGKDIILNARNQVGEGLSDSVVYQTAKTDSRMQLQGKVSPNLDIKCCEAGSNQDSPGPSLPPNDNGNIRPVNHSNASDSSEHNGTSLDPVEGPDESGKLIPQNSINVHQNEAVVCEDARCLTQAVDDSSRIKKLHEAVKGLKIKGQEEDMNSTSTSTSNDCLGENGSLGIRSSPSLNGGGGCLPPGSPPNTSVCNVSATDSSNILQNGSCSPDVHQKNILSGSVDGWKDGTVANQQSRLTGKSTDAGNAALLYFEAMLGTLTRTKESIGRATRIAIDCAKFGIAAKVVEVLVHRLETESSLTRRVDLFFLVDSIAQCSRSTKGDVGGVYPSAMQAVLPRLLSAAAPPGPGRTAHENRRQCLKVLRLWLDRKILPESIIRHHIRELDSHSSSAGLYSRRTSRTERPSDDPVRQMEGMLVDEYGSNSSFQLPGFCMPRMLKDEDEESDSDGEHFVAITPEHDSEIHEMPEMAYAIEKHRHVLEDVDGELEMEDVAPSPLEKNLPLSFVPPPPPPSSRPPPSSPSPPLLPPQPPPPPPPPPPTLHLMSATSDPYHAAVGSKVFADSQIVKDNILHSMAQPLAASKSSQPISDTVHYPAPECRDMHMLPESTRSSNTHPVQPLPNFPNSDVTLHNKGPPLRPPQLVPSNQFSFVHGERVKPQREAPAPPPPLYSNRHHFEQNLKRDDSFYNNHERSNQPLYDHRERCTVPARYSGPRYHDDRGVPAPYGCHPCEPDRRWRFPPQSRNHWDSMPFRPPFEDAIPVANRGPSYWPPR